MTTKDRDNHTTTSYMFMDRYGDGCTVPIPVQEAAINWQRVRWAPIPCPDGSGNTCIPACTTTNVGDCLTNQPGAVTNLYGQGSSASGSCSMKDRTRLPPWASPSTLPCRPSTTST